jgi:hypothetical protein
MVERTETISKAITAYVELLEALDDEYHFSDFENNVEAFYEYKDLVSMLNLQSHNFLAVS